MVTVGVLALQGDVAEHMRALEESGARTCSVRRREDFRNIDALVIPGGESTTMSNLLISLDLFSPLKELLSRGLPAWGTCAGMIMLASEVLDGREDQRCFGALDVTVRRNAFGRQVDSYEEDLEIAGLGGGPFHAVFIRAPWVERVGNGVEVLARAGNRSDAPVVAVRQGSVMATSFHPEVGGDYRMHEMFVQSIAAN